MSASALNQHPDAQARGMRYLRGRTLAQWYCLAVATLLGIRGASTLLVGASFDRPGTGWRSIQQLAVAAVLIGVQRSRRTAYRALAPFALYYLVLWTVGIINGHEAFGLIPINTRDKVIYSAYVVLAAIILALPSQRAASTEP
jgi:Domain of unknown function (DUF4383)